MFLIIFFLQIFLIILLSNILLENIFVTKLHITCFLLASVPPTNVVFILGSGNGNQESFEIQKTVIRGFVNAYDSPKVRYGFQKFGKFEFFLNIEQYKSKENFLQILEQQTSVGEGTSDDLAEALKETSQNAFKYAKHVDQNNIVVVFVEEQPSKETVENAQNILQDSVKIVAVILGNRLTRSDLEGLVINLNNVVVVTDVSHNEEKTIEKIKYLVTGEITIPNFDIFDNRNSRPLFCFSNNKIVFSYFISFLK